MFSCSLLGLQGRAGHREGVQVFGVGQKNGSWWDSSQWVVRVRAQPGGRSLTCVCVGGECWQWDQNLSPWVMNWLFGAYFLIVGSLAQLLYSREDLGPASGWYARLVDSPKEALHPLRSDGT